MKFRGTKNPDHDIHDLEEGNSRLKDEIEYHIRNQAAARRKVFAKLFQSWPELRRVRIPIHLTVYSW